MPWVDPTHLLVTILVAVVDNVDLVAPEAAPSRLVDLAAQLFARFVTDVDIPPLSVSSAEMLLITLASGATFARRRHTGPETADDPVLLVLQWSVVTAADLATRRRIAGPRRTTVVVKERPSFDRHNSRV
jgi:hypothetical protein